MKKLIAGAILLGASTLAFAQPGCGVGAMIWKDQSGIGPHALGATTNQMASQTISMTFGIAGCNINENVKSLALLMDSRGAVIAADMARGEGENLEAMAVALGIEQKDRNEFYKVITTNFSTIFPNANTTSGEAVDSIVALMQQDKALSKYVAA